MFGTDYLQLLVFYCILAAGEFTVSRLPRLGPERGIQLYPFTMIRTIRPSKKLDFGGTKLQFAEPFVVDLNVKRLFCRWVGPPPSGAAVLRPHILRPMCLQLIGAAGQHRHVSNMSGTARLRDCSRKDSRFDSLVSKTEPAQRTRCPFNCVVLFCSYSSCEF